MVTFMTTLKNIYHNCTLNPKRMGERRKTLCRIEPLEERTLLSAVSMVTNPIQTENPWDSPSAIIQAASLSTSTPTVNFSLANNSNNSSYFVEEGDDLELTLVRDNTEGSVTVFYVVDDYSSTSCRAGVDFNSTANYSNPAAVTFADGSDTATITISTTDDVFIENPEYFNVSLIYYPDYYSCDYMLNSSATTSISCTIEDNDDWSVSVTQTGESMYEMNGTASMGNNYSLSNPKFTISHTGITDPNDSYAPELKVFFNLSGTAVSDDYDLCRDRISYSKYYNTYNEFSFNGENSFDLYVNPYNNANEEDDETVILTLITNPNSWGDAGSNYQISGTTSKTITILDDDHFDITIEAVDNIATERMEEGDKDYGYFKVSRVANDNRTVLDTTYQVSVMLEDYSDCETSGEGRAFDELCAAINLRGQTNVALVGHSHGGGSVYHLSRRMAFDGQYNAEVDTTFSNRITQNYNLVFTSYIDAVKNNSTATTSSEDRLPIGTAYHLNQYQTVPYIYQLYQWSLFNGTYVVGASNFDRTALDVVHTTIDDHPQVLALLTELFESDMIR